MRSFKTTVSIIQNKHAKGKSYAFISSALGMDKLGVPTAEVRRIGLGHYPGQEVCERLGWPARCGWCKRRIPKQKANVERDPPQDFEIWWRKLSKCQRDEYLKKLYMFNRNL